MRTYAFNNVKFFLFITLLTASLLTSSCIKEAAPIEYNRPHSPWVFRSVLDSMPRMITIALNDNVWAAYSTQNAALYKVWKGGVNLDGAVYTTVHGPQPSSIGNAWFENIYPSPWVVFKNGQPKQVSVQYLGHRFENGQVSIKYELKTDAGTIQVQEQPEALQNDLGQAGFERIFTTSNVAEGVEVGLKINIGSIPFAKSLETDGTFQKEKEGKKEVDGIRGIELEGILKLNSNKTTRLATFFVKKPLYENDNKVVGAEEEEERPLGYRLIARSDCKTCHNTFRQTIGPAYVDIAQKYRNTKENVALLVGKIQNGGKGVWGETPMTPHADLDTFDLRQMVDYIMSLDAEEEAKIVATEAQTTPDNLTFVDRKENIEENDLVPGVLVRFYQFQKDLQSLDDIDFSQAAHFEGIIPNVHATDSDLNFAESNFAIEVRGYIRIPKDNNYVFRLVSDDGSRLYLNDHLVIDHDGLHGAEPKDGEIALKEGVHPFRVEFFQGYGGRNISLKWSSFNRSSFSVVPPTVLLHHKTNQLPQMSASDSGVTLADERKIPGDTYPVFGVHPSYDLSQARPDEFTPKVGGMDFLPDGRLVLSTWDAEGAVYIVDGVQTGDKSKISYKKIAAGLAEPLGLKVVDGNIYVLQKQELTQLIDHDEDEIIDEYRTLANGWTTTGNFHEFAFGLAYKDGHFYANLAIAILPGGASANPQAPDRGKSIKISKKTRQIEFIAHGLRTPNGIGIGVDNELFISDNQGDWLPASKILHLKPNAFYNSRAVDFEGTANLKVTPPVVWLPQDEIGNSPSTPSFINDGPYKGQMIHGEVTNGGIKRVFVEKVNGDYQGALFRFIQGLEAGINRLVWGPDGALYVGGIGSTGNWSHTGGLFYGLQRLKYNGKPTFEMLAVRAQSDGLEVEFTEPLAEGIGWNAKDYKVSQWWYQPTKEYGGPKMDEEQLQVLSANVSNDRKKVFLELDGMKAGHVIYIQLPNDWVSEDYHQLWSTEVWYTLNQIPANLAGKKTTTSTASIAPNTLTDKEKAAGWQLLFDGKTTNGWRNFRKENIGSSWKVQDGTLTLASVKKEDGHWQAADGGDIITADTYENYDFRVEWKIAPCGNSGIIYNVVESDEYDYVWQTGPEMQILDNSCHPDAKIPTHRASDLYDMIETAYVTVKPAGEWNKARLVVNNGKVQHWLNGHKVVETEMFTDGWRAMIAKSKFKDMPGFGKAKKGHIALQDHGDRVWFRNIKIRPLSPLK